MFVTLYQILHRSINLQVESLSFLNIFMSKRGGSVSLGCE